MADQLPATLPPSAQAGGASGNEAVLYVTQKAVDPSLGITGLNTDPAVGTDLTTSTTAVAAAETPTSVTFTAPIGVALQAGEILTFSGVSLEVAADVLASATAVQFTRIPVNIPAGSTITYKPWAKVYVRGGDLPSFLLQANYATTNFDSGQVRLPSTPTVRDENIVSGAPLDDPAQNSLYRAGILDPTQNAKKIRGYTVFSPAVGGGRRNRSKGYMTVGSSLPGSGIDTVSAWTHSVSALGAPVESVKVLR